MLRNQKISNQVFRISVLDFLGFWVHLNLSLFRSAGPLSIFGFRILLNHFIRPRQQFVRNCNTNLFCRLEVNDEFKLHRLLYR